MIMTPSHWVTHGQSLTHPHTYIRYTGWWVGVLKAAMLQRCCFHSRNSALTAALLFSLFFSSASHCPLFVSDRHDCSSLVPTDEQLHACTHACTIINMDCSIQCSHFMQMHLYYNSTTTSEMSLILHSSVGITSISQRCMQSR